MRAVLALLGWTLLGLAAAAGLALSGLALLAASDVGRPFVARTLVRFVDDALAGSLTLEGIEVLPGGGIEVRGLRVYDPEGHLALALDRARLYVDVTRLRNRSVGLAAELDGPSVLLEEEEDGQLGIARAFAPAHPSPPRPAGAPPERDRGPGWTLRLTSLAVRGGQVWWTDPAGQTRLEASDLVIDGRALIGPERSRVDLRLVGAAAAPADGPLELELRAAMDGDTIRVPVLRASVGGTGVALFGEGDLVKRTGRVALGRVAVDATRLGAIAPGAGLPGDVAAFGYAESDGREATIALRVVPGTAGKGGSADLSAAARLDGTRAVGLDAVAERLDPSALHRAAPPGAITLRARGGAAGASWEAARGRAVAVLSPSRLRGGSLGPGELQARLERGSWDVDKLALAAPGVELRGQGRWRAGGAVSGNITVDAPDLRTAARNGAALAGLPPPELSGRARVQAALAGTATAPILDGTVDIPAAASGALQVVGVKARANVAGPLAAPSGRVEATVERVRDTGADVLRSLSLRAELQGGEGRLEAQGLVPSLGTDPVTLRGRGRRVAAGAGAAGAPAGKGPREDLVRIEELALGYPGAHWTLAAPATVTLADLAGGAPATAVKVDRLELREGTGDQRLAVEGGFDRRGQLLDARVEARSVDLGRLPRGLVPASLGLAGEISARLAASGPRRTPRLEGSVSWAHGSYRDLAGLDLSAELGWDLAARRATLRGRLGREAGGGVEGSADLPVPLAGRGAEPISARLDARDLPVDVLLRTAAAPARDGADAPEDPPLAGRLGAAFELGGTVAEPTARLRASLGGASYEDLEKLSAELEATAGGGSLALDARTALDGRPALTARARLPLDLAALLAHPAATARGLRTAALQATLEVPGLDLAKVAGHLGLPPDLAGTLRGTARLEGTPAAPRGDLQLELAGGALEGLSEVRATAALRLGADAVSLAGTAGSGGTDVLALRATLRAPPERLAAGGGLAALRTLPFELDARVPRVALERLKTAVALAGTAEAHLVVDGTPAAPRLALDASGDALAVEGRPLGAAKITARWADGAARAEAHLLVPSGGSLAATASFRAPLGLPPAGAPGPRLADAPAELALRADGLDLAVLPALLPGTVRTAGGRLDADVTARGPLARPAPRGTAKIQGGRLAITEYGDWNGIEVAARITDKAIEVPTLVGHRGAGRLEGSLRVRGLRDASAATPAVLEGKLAAVHLPVSRAGMDLANLDLELAAGGTYRPGVLDVRVDLPRGTVRLPRRSPRTLQGLEPRADIAVGPRVERKKRAPARAPGADGERPFALTARLVSPGKLFVTSDNPRLKIELKADVTYELQGGSDFMTGTVETVRGDVEPFGGRVFAVQRGRVIFTGGPPRAAMLDVEAVYNNPIAVVTVAVSGPARDPEIRLTSQPSMDEGQIAMLLATGRTELKAGTGGVGTLSGEEAGKAVLGAVATQAFKELVADKLPLDQVALESGALRAGKYVTDKIYVGYTRRFEAQPEKGENQNEVRVEYQITPRWTFESRYGDAQSGGASLIWSRDY